MRAVRGSNQRPPLTARQQAAVFWGVVLLLCVCSGAASFAAGKYWLGRKLRDVEARTPKNVFPGKASEDSAASSTDKPDGSAVTPPDKAVVRVEAREPTEAEKSDAELERASKPRRGNRSSDDDSSVSDSKDRASDRSDRAADRSGRSADRSGRSADRGGRAADRGGKTSSASSDDDTGAPSARKSRDTKASGDTDSKPAKRPAKKSKAPEGGPIE